MHYHYALSILLTLVLTKFFGWGSAGPYLGSRRIASTCMSVLTAVATIFLADTIGQDWYSLQEIRNLNKGPPARFVMFIWPYIGTCTGVLRLVVSLVTIPSLISAAPNPSTQRPEGCSETQQQGSRLVGKRESPLAPLSPSFHEPVTRLP